MSIKGGMLIYHLVPIDSLESIIVRGLMSRDSLNKNNIGYIDTANQEILAKRERLGLSQYVPFHFNFYTPYDVAVKREHTDITFVYICLTRQYARDNKFLILPIHPTSNGRPELFEYDKGFEAIEWDTMELTVRSAAEYHVDLNHHRQVRMAECLSPFTVNVRNFFSITVPDSNAEEEVNRLLDKYNINNRRPYVNVHDYWFSFDEENET